MYHALHGKYFEEAQVYTLKNNVIYQDNQLGIQMEKNGINSCIGNSWHVGIRYFYVKNRVENWELEIQYCPTEIILALFSPSHFKESYSSVREDRNR